jgi:hypothetical protein
MSQDTSQPPSGNVPARAKRRPHIPKNYEALKRQMAKCLRINECKNWHDKGVALKVFAQQQNDDSLVNDSIRLQLVAGRRGGQLLMQFDGRPENSKQSRQERTLPTRKEIAERAGLSRELQNAFVRLANIPEEEFKAALEREKPPSFTALSKLGTKKRPIIPVEMPPDCKAALERALTRMSAPGDEFDGGPAVHVNKARKRLIEVMDRYPISDLSWAKRLLEHMHADDQSVATSTD